MKNTSQEEVIVSMNETVLDELRLEEAQLEQVVGGANGALTFDFNQVQQEDLRRTIRRVAPPGEGSEILQLERPHIDVPWVEHEDGGCTGNCDENCFINEDPGFENPGIFHR